MGGGGGGFGCVFTSQAAGREDDDAGAVVSADDDDDDGKGDDATGCQPGPSFATVLVVCRVREVAIHHCHIPLLIQSILEVIYYVLNNY